MNRTVHQTDALTSEEELPTWSMKENIQTCQISHRKPRRWSIQEFHESTGAKCADPDGFVEPAEGDRQREPGPSNKEPGLTPGLDLLYGFHPATGMG